MPLNPLHVMLFLQQNKTAARKKAKHSFTASLLCHFFATCLACRCFAASHPWWVWEGPGSWWEWVEKGILLRVSRATWADACLPRRRDLLRPGRCSGTVAIFLTCPVIHPGKKQVLGGGVGWRGRARIGWGDVAGLGCPKLYRLGQAASSP